MLTPGQHQLEVAKKFADVPAAICGDSMGVGKTLSCIVLDLDERKRAYDAAPLSQKVEFHFKTLIICQKGGLSVWKWHLLDQGIAEDRILVIDPSNRTPFDDELRTGALNYDYYIVHWDALIRLTYLTGRDPGKRPLKWDHVIADEVHLAKNRKAKRTKELKKIKAVKKTGASGTPADDKPQDFWSILQWAYPKDYGSYWRFYDRYLDWHTHPKNGYRVIDGTKNIDEFHRKIGPFYIRRTLEDVRGDMPPKTHGEIRVQMTPRQRRDYDAMHKFQVARVGERNEELLVTYKIAMYMRLQQMTLGTIDLDWARYEEMWEKYGHLPPYNAFVDPRRCQPKNMPSGPDVRIGEPSPKLDVVMEKVDEAMEEDESIVVFTWFKDVANLVEARCLKAKIPVSKVTGAITQQSIRDARIADFQSRKTRVFVGTIAGAGTTITLTAAHTLIFTDRAWNPSRNAQAEDRIWRINQPNACRIWDIIADDTIDDERLRRIWQKARWVDDVVNVPIHLRGLV